MNEYDKEIHYLNVDLEIESEHDISQIVKEFGEDVLLLHHGMIKGYHHAAFELAGHLSGADEAVNEFCLLVEQLSNDVKKRWERCCTRRIDIGYESGTTPQSFRSEIRASTVQRVADIGANIVITMYPISVVEHHHQKAEKGEGEYLCFAEKDRKDDVS